MLYLSVLDRARLSERHEGWRDEGGFVWCLYTVRALAADLGRSESAVKAGLQGLEDKGLLRRERRGQGKPDRLFVNLPEDDETPAGPESLPPEGPEPPPQEGLESPPPEVRKPTPPGDGNPPPSKNYKERTMEQNPGSKKRAYGDYGNVLLTDAEHEALRREFAGLDVMLHKASILLKYEHKTYPDHAALLRRWARTLWSREPFNSA